MSPRATDNAEGAARGPAVSGRGRRLPLRLVPVTQANWQAVIALRVDDEQAGNLASNLYSLAEAYVEPRCQPRAIVAGRTVIGFLMYEYIEARNTFSIPRFMIDAQWQGHGYGAAALAEIIDTFRQTRPEAAITISLRTDNHAAWRLYERLGFVDTGERVHGEAVLRHNA